MKGRRKSSPIRKILWLFLLLLIINSLRTWYTQEKEARKLQAEEEAYQEQITLLQSEIEKLQYTLENITDDEFIEAIARKNLKMVREDEWVLIDIQERNE